MVVGNSSILVKPPSVLGGLILPTGWCTKDNTRPRSWQSYGPVTFLNT